MFKRAVLLSLALLLLTTTGCGAINQVLREPTLAPTISLPTDAPLPLPGELPEPTATPTLLPGEVLPVWVANPVDRSVLRIDPRDNTIAARIQINGQPDVLAVSEWDVWALDRRDDTVHRIDIESERVRSTISLPEGEAEDIAAGGGSAWVGMTGKITLDETLLEEDHELAPPGWVVRIDPSTDSIAERLPVQPVSRVILRGPAMWVLSRTEIDTPLQLFDLRSGQGVAVPLYNGPEWLPSEALAVGPDCFWLFSSAHSAVFRIGFDGRVQARVQLQPSQPTGYAQLLLAEDGLWAATPWGSIAHIDALTNHLIGELPLGIPLSSLTAGQGIVWAVSQQTGTVYRIDPAALQVTASIPTGSTLLPTIVPSPTPRVVVWKPCEDAATSRLKVGDIAYVTKDPPIPNRVRQEPNREAEILGLINPGGSMDVIDGPACSDGWVWWKVKNADYEGWTAEGDQETYWLVPLVP